MHSGIRFGRIDHWPAAGMIDGRLRGHHRATLDVEPRCAEAVIEHHRIESNVDVAAGEGKDHEDGLVLSDHQERSANADAKVGHNGD